MGLMRLVSSELQYSVTFLGGYLEMEGYPLFSLRRPGKSFLGSVRVRQFEHLMGQLVNVSHTLEVVTLSCSLHVLAKGMNA